MPGALARADRTQRKAEYVFAKHVDDAMARIEEEKELAKSGKRSTAAE